MLHVLLKPPSQLPKVCTRYFCFAPSARLKMRLPLVGRGVCILRVNSSTQPHIFPTYHDARRVCRSTAAASLPAVSIYLPSQLCVRHCRSDHAFAATRNGHDCYCYGGYKSDDAISTTSKAESQCNTDCARDSSVRTLGGTCLRMTARLP